MYRIKHDTILKFSEKVNVQFWELRNYGTAFFDFELAELSVKDAFSWIAC